MKYVKRPLFTECCLKINNESEKVKGTTKV